MATGSHQRKKQDPLEIRLPRNVIPVRYAITLCPDLEKATFKGEETVEIQVLEPVSVIKVNAKELRISTVYVEAEDGTRLNGSVSIDKKTEIATITFSGIIGAGDWKFFARFSGILNDKLKGFYRSQWKDDEGGVHTIATTQFEATDARRAFPCWDEPEFKATFQVSLIVDDSLVAISNGEVVSEGTPIKKHPLLGRGASKKPKKMVEFTETMKMSTYLVAFVIGEFESSEPVNVNGKQVRIWCVPGKKHLTAFALKAAAYGLDWYEEYFKIPYPGGNKIDHIAIPDFAAGAMENLGCITYRETALLVDEKTAPHAALVRVAVVVLHELAHMWFGDLVTMKWWNGLWLNESFATFMENLCLSNWKPEWNVFEEFSIHRAAASEVDALVSTHPIECPVNHPDEIDELFDVISYEKGCAVLYQLHQFIGADVFRQGIGAYLKKHAYGNTETHDLWDALEEAARANGLDVPVREIMDYWVFTSGHPVIEVSEGEADGTIVLAQKPFKFTCSDEQSVWPIPVIIRIRNSKGEMSEKKVVLKGASETLFVGEGFDHVVVNAGGSGFYRVIYSDSLNAKLTDEVGTTLSVVERFNLVNDIWATTKAGITPVSEYVEVVKLFGGERDPNVWSILISSMGRIHRMLDDDRKPDFETTVRELIAPAVAELGWDGADSDNVQTVALRAKLIGTLGTIGADADVQSRAVEYFERWKADQASVDANLAAALVNILAHVGDQSRYDEFWKLSQEAKTPQDTLRFLGALAQFRDPELLERTIEMCLSEDVRTQDAPFLFAQLLSNPDAAPQAWKYLKGNFAAMVKAYPESGVVRMCGAAQSLDTPDLAGDVRKFFGKTKVKAGDMAIAQMLEKLDINVRLRTEHVPASLETLVGAQPVS